jgi:hypothetical protein
VAARYEAVRLQNLRIALSARTHHFGNSQLPFLCECDDKECHGLITLSLDEYDGYRDMYLYLVATGHRFAGGTCVASGEGFQAYRLRQPQRGGVPLAGSGH